MGKDKNISVLQKNLMCKHLVDNDNVISIAQLTLDNGLTYKNIAAVIEDGFIYFDNPEYLHLRYAYSIKHIASIMYQNFS